MTVAVAAEALRGIQMMERMEKSIEKRKDREALLVGKLKDAFRGDIKQRELESRLQEVEAEATEQASEIEELRAALKERQEHAHAADADLSTSSQAEPTGAAEVPAEPEG